MTKLLAAIKELVFHWRGWEGGVLCSQRKPFYLSCVILSSRIMACLILWVNSSKFKVATNINHQCNPNYTDHIKVLTLLRQLLQTHTELKNTTYMDTTAVTPNSVMQWNRGQVWKCTRAAFGQDSSSVNPTSSERVPYSFAVKLGWKTVNEQ